MNRRLSFRALGSLVSTFLLASFGSAFSAAPMQAQAPTTAVGSISATQTATVTITTPGTLSQIAVVTQGATGLDYQVAAGGSCAVNTPYIAGATCTVNYTFSPTHPWVRYGGISLSDASGALLGNFYLAGKGTGPQVSYPPSATTVPTALISTGASPVGIVVDGNGNVYFTDSSAKSVKEIVAVGGVIPLNPTVNTLATGFNFPRAIALDGSGNLFVADSAANVVKEIVAVGGTIPASPVIRTIGTGFSTPSGIAVDGGGNLYVADTGNTSVKQVVAANGVISDSPTINTLAPGVNPSGVAVDAAGDVFFANGSGEIDELVGGTGAPVKVATVTNLIGLAIDGAGDLYYPDNTGKAVYELVAVGGVIPATPTPVALGTGFDGPNGVVVDGAGNVFVADSGSVKELSFQTPPTVTFTSTAANTISSDSPMVLTIGNNGTDPLVFTTQAASTNFILNTGTSTCPAASVAAGATCTDSISFDPSDINPKMGTLTSTDNNLNGAAVQQMVPLAGGVASPSITVPNVSTTVDGTTTLTAVITFNGNRPGGAFGFTVNGSAAGVNGPDCEETNATTTTCTSTFDASAAGLNVGSSYPIVANLAADISNNAATGNGTLTITTGASSVSLGTSNGSVAVNTQVTFTATVSPTSGVTPSGAVSFTSTLGAGSPVAIAGCTNLATTAGVAKCVTSALPQGAYTITANLASDTNFTGSSNTVAQVINQATPGVTVAASANNAPVNTAITFTASVTPTTGITPTGTVSFSSKVGTTTTPIASCSGANAVALSSTTHQAACTTSVLPQGSYTITATYNGDGNFATATSNNLSQTVIKADPAVVLGAVPTASTVNDSVVLTATVTPNSGILPGGTVNFTTALNGGGAATISGCGAVVVSPTTHQAVCTTTALLAGSNSLVATIAGDTNFNPASSTAVPVTVNMATPALVLTASGTGTSALNASVTFTATVTPNSGILPQGTVTFTTNVPAANTSIAGCTGVAVNTTSHTATCTTSLLNAGSNSINASIAADANFKTAAATAIPQTVTQGTPVLTLDLGPTGVAVNGTSTFTASITPNTGVVPSGTISFTTTFNHGTPTVITGCSAAPLVAATGPTRLTAICVTNALLGGENDITVSYAGDSNYVAAAPVTQADTILALNPTLVVTSAPAPSTVDQSVTFTATLASVTFTPTNPTGTVTFNAIFSGGPIPGCDLVPLNPATHSATCTTSSLTAGSDVIQVSFATGDTNYNSVVAPNYTQTVTKGATATAVLSSPPSAVVNQQVTFTATITPTFASANGVPIGGSVTFTKGGVNICNPAVVSSNANGTGTASCSVAFTSAFTSTGIVANYSGDSNFTTSVSQPVAQTVAAEPTTTTVASQLNPSQVNQPVTLTATVTFTASSGVTFPATTTQPAGTVAFSDSLDAGGSPFCSTAIANGTPSPVTCNHTFLSSGNHVITATFTPTDSNYATSTSTGLTQQVNASGTTSIMVGTTTPTLTVDQSATFTAVFTPTVTGTQPAGTVSYFDSILGASPIPGCSALTVTAAGTIPNCVETMLAAGTHNISAVFTPQPGNSNFPSMTSPLFPQIVAQNTTSVTLTAPTTPSVVDQVVTFAATVTPGTLAPAGPGTTTPTGTIAFTYGPSATLICSAPVSTTGGVSSATCNAPFTAVGTYNVTASYSGDTNFKTSASSPAFAEVVGKASTSIGLGSAGSITPTSPAVNQSAAYTVQISVLAPAIGPGAGSTVPAGNVVFTDASNATVTCTAVLQTNGQASCSLSEPTAGAHTINVTYTGDSNFSASGPTSFPVTIGASGTSVASVSVSPTSTPVVNQSVTLNATVNASNPGSKIPSGTVTFTDSNPPNADGICVSTLTAAGLVPACPYSFTTSGTHTLTAVYSGDSNFSTSSATPITVNVGTAGGTNLVVSTLTPSPIVNQSATFTATFTPPPSGTQPQGKVSYFDSVLGASPIPGCSALSVTAAGAIPNCTETLLTAGTHNITAMFTTNDTNFSNLTSAAFPQAVAQNTTSVSLTPPSASVVDQVVTFTATVTPTPLTPAGAGTTTPTGTITFTYTGGATPICSAPVSPTTGSATCSAPFTAVGTYNVTATYSGDTNFKTSASTPTFAEVVSKANTSVGLSGASITPGSPAVNQSAPYTVQISVLAPASGPGTGSTVPTGNVVFTDVSNAAVTCTAVLQASGLASCQLSEPTTGAHTINVVYTGDSNFNASSVTPFTVTIGLGATNISAPTVAPPGALTLNQSVTLNATLNFTSATGSSALPTGTVTFSDNSAGHSTITCVVTLTTASGGVVPGCPYSFTSSGTHTLSVTYSGDSNFSSSASATATTVTVSGITTTSIQVGTTTPSAIVNQTATFTAIFVPPVTGTQPQGTVSYFDDRIVSGTNPTGAIAGCSSLTVSAAGTIPNCSEVILVAGNHNISAVFTTSNGNFQNITSPPFPQAISAENTSLTVTTPTAPAVGALANYTVQIVLAGGSSDTGTTKPTGFVTFTDAANSSVTCTTQVAQTPPCQLAEPTVGPHTIKVSYNGDSNFNASTTTVTVTVVPATPSVSLTSFSAVANAANTSVATQPVVFTAAVVPPTTAGATPTGTFTFTITPAGPSYSCAGVAINAATNTATCTATFPKTVSGNFTVVAAYSGDSNYAAAQSSITQTVLNFTPTIFLVANPTGSVTVSQATVVSGSNSFSNTSLTDPFLPVQTTKVTIAPLGGTNSDAYAVTGCVLVPTVTDLTCAPTTDKTGVVFTTTADATTVAPVGVYTAQVTITDTNVPTLSQPATIQVAVSPRPKTLFVGSVGSASTTFTLPVAASSALSCDGSNVLTVNKDGTYSTVAGASTFAQIGITCSVTGPVSGVYTVKITAGQQTTSKLETGYSSVIAATLGAPFLLLFGLLPAFRKQRKLLVRGLGMLLMAIAIMQTTGCGGGSFNNPNQNVPSAATGSYLIRIQDATGKTIAEVPVFISNGTTN